MLSTYIQTDVLPPCCVFPNPLSLCKFPFPALQPSSSNQHTHTQIYINPVKHKHHVIFSCHLHCDRIRKLQITQIETCKNKTATARRLLIFVFRLMLSKEQSMFHAKYCLIAALKINIVMDIKIRMY